MHILIRINKKQYNYFKKHKILKSKLFFDNYYDICYYNVLHCKLINKKIDNIKIDNNNDNNDDNNKLLSIPLTENFFIKNKYSYINTKFGYAILENSYVSPMISYHVSNSENNLTSFRKILRKSFLDEDKRYYLLNSIRLFEKVKFNQKINLKDFEELNVITEITI